MLRVRFVSPSIHIRVNEALGLRLEGDGYAKTWTTSGDYRKGQLYGA